MLPEARAVHAGLTWLPLPAASAPVSGLPAAAALDPQKREPKMKTQ